MVASLPVIALMSLPTSLIEKIFGESLWAGFAGQLLIGTPLIGLTMLLYPWLEKRDAADAEANAGVNDGSHP